MANTSNHHDLASWVRQILQAPVRMDHALLDFLETTLGTRDPAAVLSELDNSETASFLDLLFYPDRQMRLDFEERWGERLFSEMQAEELVHTLLDAPITATFQIDFAPHAMPMQVPVFVIRGFIERLKITWRAPARLTQILNAVPQHRPRVELRAQFRHARLDWHEGQIGFIDTFLTRMPVASEDFEPCLRFVLSILSELGPAEAAFDFLIAKKAFFFRCLCQKEVFEQRRRDSNMEILILQGERAAHGDIAHWRDGMRLVDRLCLAMYGRTHFFQRSETGPSEALCGTPDECMQTLFHKLS